MGYHCFDFGWAPLETDYRAGQDPGGERPHPAGIAGIDLDQLGWISAGEHSGREVRVENGGAPKVWVAQIEHAGGAVGQVHSAQVAGHELGDGCVAVMPGAARTGLELGREGQRLEPATHALFAHDHRYATSL